MLDNQFCIQNFQSFVSQELPRVLEVITQPDQDAEMFVYCLLTRTNEPSRRVLVITEPQGGKIAVCIEAAYELFEGDIHHYVRQIGLLDRSEATERLESLVREAYELVMAWRPTFENIEANIYLPN